MSLSLSPMACLDYGITQDAIILTLLYSLNWTDLPPHTNMPENSEFCWRRNLKVSHVQRPIVFCIVDV